MPKKTKREKIIALYRKKLKLLQTQPTQLVEVKPKPGVTKKTTSEFRPAITINEPPVYFFADLKKSLILIVFIIALEISLYFATINNYLKF